MNRVAGWRFLDMGRRIERAINTCRFAMRFAGDDGDRATISTCCCRSVDSQITYGARYLLGVALDPVRDMVLLDPFNPRSVAFQVEAIAGHLGRAAGPAGRRHARAAPAPRGQARRPRSPPARPAEFDGARPDPASSRAVERLADAIADRYFLQGPHAAATEKLVGLA